MGPSIDSCWRRLLSCPKSMLESKYCMDELKKTHRFKWNPMVVQTVCSFSVVVYKAAEWSKTEKKNHGDWRRQIVIKLISYRRFTESPSPSETPREHVTSQFGSRLFSYYFPRFLFFRFMALVSACWLDNMCSICLTLCKRSVSLEEYEWSSSE